MQMIQQASVIDLYKSDHISQYVPNTEYVGSNMTPRSDRLARVIREHFDGKMVWFGLQYAMKVMVQRWDDTFFNVPKEQAIGRYKRLLGNAVGTDYIDNQVNALAKLHDVGYLPIKIKALPEGSLVNMQIPTFTITNTDPELYWLVNYLETFLSCTIWPMCNSAGVTRQYRQTSERFGAITGADPFWYMIANHCFAARGHRGQEDAMLSGMGHSLFSAGTDTFWAIDAMEIYYNANTDTEMVGLSVSAAEHATATQRIAYFAEKLGVDEYTAEVASVRDFCERVYPTGIFSYVSDSKDYYRFITDGLAELKDVILGRKPNSQGLVKFVVRPDSSPKTPLEVICGDPEAPVGSAEYRGSLEILGDTFGTTVNEKGFKLLNPMVGIIYGEAIDIEMQAAIYQQMIDDGWCVSNLLLGVGSWGFLDRASRDSYSICVKGTNSIVEGNQVSMQKDPKTAAHSKKSAKGLLMVTKEDGDFVLYDDVTPEQEEQGELQTVFLNGDIVKETSFREIQETIANG